MLGSKAVVLKEGILPGKSTEVLRCVELIVSVSGKKSCDQKSNKNNLSCQSVFAIPEGQSRDEATQVADRYQKTVLG